MTSNTHLVPRIEDLQLRPIVTVGPAVALQAAAAVMRAHNISSVVVSEPGEPLSILTERDLTRALAEDCEPGTPVATLASPHPVTVPPDATAMDAATLMLREDIRHLVVAQGDHAIGIVSIRDLLAVLVRTVTPDTVFVMLRRLELEASENWLG
jgi:CBS domain-containing protein